MSSRSPVSIELISMDSDADPVIRSERLTVK